MTRRNISHTHDALLDRPETEQVYVDGDTSEAIFRAICEDVTDELEAFVEDELDGAEIQSCKWVGFGYEVTVA